MISKYETKGMPAQPMVAPNVKIVQADLLKRMKMNIAKAWKQL
jgi:hypothetical protein